MDWPAHEHAHAHASHALSHKDRSDLSPCAQLRLGLAERIGVPHCHLLPRATDALLLAARLLFSPALGERALYPGDEALVLYDGGEIAAAISACGGCPIPVQGDTAEADLGRALEAALSPATRAVAVGDLPDCHEKMQTVRNFCNKYDLWMVESVHTVTDAIHTVCGALYRAGAVGDWSCLDLSALGITGGALLIRDDFVNRLALERLADAFDEKSAQTGCENLQKLCQGAPDAMGGACL